MPLTTTGAGMGSGVGGITATTFDPAHLSNVSLSGGNLKATSTSSSSSAARTVFSASSDKYYWELLSGIASGASGVAIATSSWVPGTGTGLVIWFCSNAVYTDGGGTFLGSIPFPASGNSVAIAVDLGAKLIWFRALTPSLGNWNNSGSANPATGVGGFSWTTVTGSAPYYGAVNFANANDNFTANFGQNAFIGPVPSGFTAGLGS